MQPNPQETADLVTFTDETPNGKLYLLCSDIGDPKFTQECTVSGRGQFLVPHFGKVEIRKK